MEQNRLTLWLAFVIAIITSIAPTILALAAYRQSAATHDVVNSRMSEMIVLVKSAATDAATLAEKNAQHQREDETKEKQ